MKLTRVKHKNSDDIVYVISADSKQLAMLSFTAKGASDRPMGYHVYYDPEKPSEKVLIINDKLFENIDETGLLKREDRIAKIDVIDVYRYIDAHIVKWGIKPKKAKKKEPKNKGKRFKIDVE